MEQRYDLSELTKEKIEETLDNILEALNSGDVEGYDWYCNFFPEAKRLEYDWEENIAETCFAEEAIKHHKLHSKMKEIVEKITHLVYDGEVYSLWENEEEQAGGGFGLELALYDKDNIITYGKYLSTNDLNHEVYQNEHFCDIMSKWGMTKETYALMAARWFTPGQHGHDGVSMWTDEAHKAFKDEKEIDDFLEMTAKWFIEEWFAPYTVGGEEDYLKEYFYLLLKEPLGLSEEKMEEFSDKFISIVSEGKYPKLDDIIN